LATRVSRAATESILNSASRATSGILSDAAGGHQLEGLTHPWLRLLAKVVTDWDATVASMAVALGGDLRAALAEVALARERPYFDAEADRVAAEACYGNVSLDGLGDLVDSTHTVKPGYKPAQELYPWVDLQPDGKLRSLYTAQIFDPRT
jgi:hypothetical protein